jgi:hypothetical protein
MENLVAHLIIGGLCQYINFVAWKEVSSISQLGETLSSGLVLSTRSSPDGLVTGHPTKTESLLTPRSVKSAFI